MKVFVIFGSPRRSGNTKRLLNGFVSGLDRSAEIETVSVFDLAPAACDDCGYCKGTDACRKKDLEDFFKKFGEADVIVFATPVYNLGLPAPVKALFDRFQRFYNARHERNVLYSFRKERKGILLVTGGYDSRVGYDIIRKQCSYACNLLNIKPFADIFIPGTDEHPVGSLDLCKAQYLARELSKEYAKNDN
ncbi:MAG: flavodoxin family protein [Ruminococcaceae bacterium]|jgi:multimeric flavodoxin WrbA|nr:flavodoxin family protein [Oscillospiraceae bacterium]